MLGDVFDKLALFEGLNGDQLELLRSIFVPRDSHTGTRLFEQGEPAEYLYLVVAGEVIIHYKPDDGPEILVARVRPGGVAGWSALLGNRLYTSGATCTAYSQMLRARGEDLRMVCLQNPEIGEIILAHLADMIAERLHSTHDQVLALLKQGLLNGIHSY